MRKRGRKPDRITNPKAVGSVVEESIYQALRPHDAVVTEMENKWGADRLVELVSPELAQRFGKAKAQLDQAIDQRDPDAVAQKAAAMIRGWQALDKAATQNGSKPISAKLRIVRDDDGKAFGIAVSASIAREAVRRGEVDGVSVWTLEEVVRVISAHEMQLVNKVKETFPGATVEAIRDKQKLDDELPF